MKLSIDSLRNSIGAKVAVIGILVLVLLIPAEMINGVVLDRSIVEDEARYDIQSSWGGEQLVAGPVLKLAFKSDVVDERGSALVVDRNLFSLASSVRTTAEIDSETRYLGIFKVPVYSALLSITAIFDLDVLEENGIERTDLDLSKTELLIAVSDPTAINETPLATVGGQDVQFQDARNFVSGFPPQLSASLAAALRNENDDDTINVTISLHLNGSGSLMFMPLGNDSRIDAVSNWDSPGFVGRRLPSAHDISADGFSAQWQATGLGRAMPSSWVDSNASGIEAVESAFGVRLVQQVGLYQLMFRALNYAVMFVGLTFIAWFMMEIVANIRMHPLQYLLVGIANLLFYLLLLSLAEHIWFGAAFLIAATASAGLIVGYSRSVLQYRGHVLAMLLVMTGLYAFLYMTLRAETFALLAGSIGLWLILAAVMYLTRKIDWYRH